MNYENALIYKICCRDVSITDVYIGHTTNFIKRKAAHKTSCNNEKATNHNCFVYKFIKENGGWDNWDMILVEKISCNDKLEALQKERYYIEIFKATLNSNVPSRTLIEYKKQNQGKIQEYYEENKDKFRLYREQNQTKINEYQKLYYEQNQDKIKEYRKLYRKQNKK